LAVAAQPFSVVCGVDAEPADVVAAGGEHAISSSAAVAIHARMFDPPSPL
jgi:hypothetical protein